jgi:hypothetical protein
MNDLENVVESVVTQQVEASDVAPVAGVINSHVEAIKTLLANGGKRINGVRIKNVNVTEKDNYTMVSFTLANPVRGFVTEDGGITFKEGTTTTIFTSLFAIGGIMKEDEDLSWMANSLAEHPAALNLVLNGATIDIIQQDVPAGTIIRNPFSTRGDQASTNVYDHDIIINHIIKFKLGRVGEKMSERFADKLFGF